MQDAEIQSWLGSNPAEKTGTHFWSLCEWELEMSSCCQKWQTGESRQKYHQKDTQNSVPALPRWMPVSSFGDNSSRKKLQSIRRESRARRTDWRLAGMVCKERLSKLGWFSPKKRNSGKTGIVLKHEKGWCKQNGNNHFSTSMASSTGSIGQLQFRLNT